MYFCSGALPVYPINLTLFNILVDDKASTIWSKKTGIDRNPADHVEVQQTFYRLRILVLIALTSGTRIA
jgi:hypothetical protein